MQIVQLEVKLLYLQNVIQFWSVQGSISIKQEGLYYILWNWKKICVPLEINFDFIRAVSSKCHEFFWISTSGNSNNVTNSHCRTYKQ